MRMSNCLYFPFFLSLLTGVMQPFNHEISAGLFLFCAGVQNVPVPSSTATTENRGRLQRHHRVCSNSPSPPSTCHLPGICVPGVDYRYETNSCMMYRNGKRKPLSRLVLIKTCYSSSNNVQRNISSIPVSDIKLG